MRRKSHTDEAGHTVAELLVAMAILAMVISLLSSMQLSIYRGSDADQSLGDVLRPVRDGLDHISRDVEIALIASTPGDPAVSGGRYVSLRQNINGQKRFIYFWIDGDHLVRAVQNVTDWDQEDRALAAPNPLVYGIETVPTEPPFRMVGAGTIRVSLQAVSSGVSSTEIRKLKADIVSHKEVARCTATSPC